MAETLWAALSNVADYSVYVCGFLTAFFAMRVTLRFAEPKPGRWPLALLYLVHYFTANAIVYTGVGDYLPPLLMLLCFIGGLLVCCKGRRLSCISMGVILVLLPMSLNAVLTSIRPPFDLFIFPAMSLFWGILLFAVSKTMPQNRRPPIDAGRLWLLVDILTLMPLGAVLSAVALTRPIPMNENPDPFRDSLMVQNERALLVILGLSVIASLVILASVVLLSRHEKLEEEQRLWQMRSQYYQGVEEAQQQVRRLRHDMANHFTALAGLEGDAARRYLEQLSHTPAMQTGFRHCENQVANAVLSAKLPLMEAGGVAYEGAVRLPEGIPISDIDLCALLANGLDNAIEASRKLPAVRRNIRLSAAVDKGFFVLRLVNAADEVLPMREGRLLTSKKKRELHGFGLASIKEVAGRYGGTVQLEGDGRSVCLLVMIPVGM